MGRRPAIFDLVTAPRRRISLRISLWGSRPLNLNFFFSFFLSPESGFLPKSRISEGKKRPCEERQPVTGVLELENQVLSSQIRLLSSKNRLLSSKNRLLSPKNLHNVPHILRLGHVPHRNVPHMCRTGMCRTMCRHNTAKGPHGAL